MTSAASAQERASSVPVPVARGTSRCLTTNTGRVLITEARFPPHARLAKHFHDRSSVVIATGGICVSAIGSAQLQMLPGDVVVEPAGETHANQFGSAGTDVIILQPDPHAIETFEPCEQLLSTGGRIREAALRPLAQRIHRELAEPDAFSNLALDAAALEFVATAARASLSRRANRRWFGSLVEYMHEEVLSMPTIAELSAVAGIHPAHLSREFRRVYRTSPVTYMRRLRIEWAAQELRTTDAPVSQIAAAAGFADQSHFTRVFRRFTGTTPAQHRTRGGLVARATRDFSG